ncbi:MAG: aldo/keto reductase, partial [Lachnospiraceae bacterium]|nr:aldo/keto reductase [Lachnospiraceae bacterium]
MKYTNIDEINKPLSRFVYGTTSASFEGDEPKAFDSLDAAWEAGFRVFDTAHSYGEAERVLGKWLEKRGCREETVILDKGLNPGQKGFDDVYSADTIREQFKMSLDRLQTDHVEMYILHRDDPTKPVDEIVEVLNELKADGKIIRFGGSNWTMKRTKEANAYAEKHGLIPFSVCSPSYSLAKLENDPWGGSVTLTGDDNKPFRDWLTQNQMPVFNYSALARGYLSGKYHSDDSIPIEACLGSGTIAEYKSEENRLRLGRIEKLA